MVNIDETLFSYINGLVGKSSLLDSMMRVGVNDYFVPVCLVLFLVFLWFGGEWCQKCVISGLIGVGIVSGITKVINVFYFRSRPFQSQDLISDIPLLKSRVSDIFYFPHDSSFPANAPAVAFALATAVFWGEKRWGILAYLLAFFISFARIFAGVHYPSDVAAGCALGIGTTYAMLKLIPRLEPYPGKFIGLLRKVFLA
jgi:membrane-associated phospholipid phosphatase